MRDISLHLLDIIQNSISARASKITVSVSADTATDELIIKVEDNGVGMDDDLLKQVIDPFTTTRSTRKIGLGIPLLKDSAERAGGRLEISSGEGEGTIVVAYFNISHIDRLPIGDIGETMVNLVMAEPEIEYVIEFVHGDKRFLLRTEEVKDKIGEVPITQYEVLEWVRGYIKEGLSTIFGGVLNEVHS